MFGTPPALAQLTLSAPSMSNSETHIGSLARSSRVRQNQESRHEEQEEQECRTTSRHRLEKILIFTLISSRQVD